MRRKIYEKLLSWKANPDRKPLILGGARQVGKTWIATEFGKNEYEDMAYVNCLEESSLKELVSLDSNPHRILQGIKAITGKDIEPGKTLVFIDEVQEAIRMLPVLKSFHERIPDLDIIVAGSLLGVALHEGVSYPVGKVDELIMYPMDFEEFLWGLGEENLAEMIKDYDSDFYNPFHDKLIDYLKNYFYVGGMPEVVYDFSAKRSYSSARAIQQSILNGYTKDFSKHITSPEMSLRISLIWKALPSQIAKENKKFIFSAIKPSARSRDYETAIEWLESAGLAKRVTRVKDLQRPLEFYNDEGSFKLFPLDCGLLGAMMDVSARDIILGEGAFTEYKGAFTETYVFQQLLSNYPHKIYYYSNENSTAEIDFCLDSGNIVPIEVKGGRNITAKSMVKFLKQSPETKGFRLSENRHHQGDMIDDIPLYCACAFARKMSEDKLLNNSLF